MRPYTGFAAFYDRFMEDIPYDQWCARIIRKLRAHGIEDGLVLELGCGTGTMTEKLSDAGYDLIGVDASEEMLSAAMEKRGDRNILYLEQDMRSFELYGTVRAVVCVCDAINYITDRADLVQVFRLVNNYLDPGGLFLFDFNTPGEYSREERVSYADECGGIYLIGRNEYSEKDRLNEHTVTFFVPEEEEEEIYVRIEETHVQRAYTPEEMKEALAEAGLVFLSAENADGDDPGREAEGPEEDLFAGRAETGMRRCLITAAEHGKS